MNKPEMTLDEKDQLATLWMIHRTLVVAEYKAAVECNSNPALVDWFIKFYYRQLPQKEQLELTLWLAKHTEQQLIKLNQALKERRQQRGL